MAALPRRYGCLQERYRLQLSLNDSRADPSAFPIALRSKSTSVYIVAMSGKTFVSAPLTLQSRCLSISVMLGSRSNSTQLNRWVDHLNLDASKLETKVFIELTTRVKIPPRFIGQVFSCIPLHSGQHKSSCSLNFNGWSPLHYSRSFLK